ncbi:hypothetical protein AGMMS49975_09910 [Clostridia bacterium]|nr:hypothetical protein AGMMS49975_09910 [Clostridia bacterium]
MKKDCNFFDLTALPFDPPEKNRKQVSDAIDKAIKVNEGLFNTLQGVEYENKLDFLKSKKTEFFTSDGKLSDSYTKFALAHTESMIRSLRSTAEIMKSTGKSAITEVAIKAQIKRTKLSDANVKKAFIEAGFTITKIDPLSAMPKFPANIDDTYNKLALLRETKDPDGADLTIVFNMYDFVAYLKKEPSKGKLYRAMSTPELSSICNAKAIEIADIEGNTLVSLLKGLTTAGRSFIFESDETRRAYDAHLLYKLPQMTKLFEHIGNMTNSDRYTPRIADGCIKQIADVFGSADVALAIYNNVAKLKEDPYIPEKSSYYVKCAHCHSTFEFEDITEAQKINKCSSCQKALFQPCKKCGKPILLSLEKCPECGFIFASAPLFKKYIAQADDALSTYNFSEARKYVIEAEVLAVEDSEKEAVANIRRKIASEEKQYEKPLSDLRQLVIGREFYTASGRLSQIMATFPKLNVKEFEVQIRTGLSRATMLFDGAKTKSAVERADVCLEILEACRDYKPALDFLHATPPSAPQNFNIAQNTNRCSASIGWTRLREQGISYSIIRKLGTDIPRNEKDGDIIASKLTENSFLDDKLLPGTYYSYAVFAERNGVYSSGTGKTVAILAEISDLRYEQKETALRISWTMPQNCAGVSILKKSNGKETILTNNAQGYFDDTGLIYENIYSYILRANYQGMPQSSGIGFVLTPMERVEPFPIEVQNVKDNRYSVTWKIPQKSVPVRVVVDDSVVSERKSGEGGCEFELSENGYYKVEVLASSAGRWIRCTNIETINTFRPCEIDRDSVQLVETPTGTGFSVSVRVKIKEPIPSTAFAFKYLVRTKTLPTDKAPWCTESDVKDIPVFSIDTYKKYGCIQHDRESKNEDAYYLTLFTIYKVQDRDIISSPYKLRVPRVLNINVDWSIAGALPFAKTRKLNFEISSNYQMNKHAHLILCGCDKGHYLTSPSDNNAIVIKDIPEEALATPSKSMTYQTEISTSVGGRALKDLKLKMFCADSEPYENYVFVQRN